MSDEKAIVWDRTVSQLMRDENPETRLHGKALDATEELLQDAREIVELLDVPLTAEGIVAVAGLILSRKRELDAAGKGEAADGAG